MNENNLINPDKQYERKLNSIRREAERSVFPGEEILWQRFDKGVTFCQVKIAEKGISRHRKQHIYGLMMESDHTLHCPSCHESS